MNYPFCIIIIILFFGRQPDVNVASCYLYSIVFAVVVVVVVIVVVVVVVVAHVIVPSHYKHCPLWVDGSLVAMAEFGTTTTISSCEYGCNHNTQHN